MKKGQKRIWITFAVGLALLLSGCGAKNQPVSATQVYLEEGQVSLQGPGAVYDQDNGQVTIDQGGSYELSGSTEGIRFLINLEDPKPVKLILNGVNLTSPGTAAITCLNADKLVIILRDGNLSISSNSVGILAGHVSVEDGSLSLSTQGTEIEILE